MADQIVIREIQKNDHALLEQTIAKTWKFAERFSNKTAVILSKACLLDFLAEQTFTRVAVVNGSVIGVIMGISKNKRKVQLHYVLPLLLVGLRLCLTSEGRIAVKGYSVIKRIYQRLLKRSKKSYDAELSFFVVDPSYRGLGLGKRLFQCFIQYMKEEKVSNFFLYTDTECNYQFYDKQGMQKQCEEDFALDFSYRGNRNEFNGTCFLYDYSVCGQGVNSNAVV